MSLNKCLTYNKETSTDANAHICDYPYYEKVNWYRLALLISSSIQNEYRESQEKEQYWFSWKTYIHTLHQLYSNMHVHSDKYMEVYQIEGNKAENYATGHGLFGIICIGDGCQGESRSAALE